VKLLSKQLCCHSTIALQETHLIYLLDTMKTIITDGEQKIRVHFRNQSGIVDKIIPFKNKQKKKMTTNFIDRKIDSFASRKELKTYLENYLASKWLENPQNKNKLEKQIAKTKRGMYGFELSKMSHDEYLETERWKRLRKKVLERDIQCVLCGSNKNLQVHHKSYNHKGCHAWTKEAADCITVCRRCHKIIHGIN